MTSVLKKKKHKKLINSLNKKVSDVYTCVLMLYDQVCFAEYKNTGHTND